MNLILYMVYGIMVSTFVFSSRFLEEYENGLGHLLRRVLENDSDVPAEALHTKSFMFALFDVSDIVGKKFKGRRDMWVNCRQIIEYYLEEYNGILKTITQNHIRSILNSIEHFFFVSDELKIDFTPGFFPQCHCTF